MSELDAMRHAPRALPVPPRTVVVMGVSGCGKSLVGERLARRLGADFDDADDLHPPANKAKMSRGIPLDDEDRWPWYRILRRRILEQRATGRMHVLACSALREAYRKELREADTTDELVFVFLKGSRDLIAERLAARQGHFMPPSLLDSQLATLEEPREAITVDIARNPDAIVDAIVADLSSWR